MHFTNDDVEVARHVVQRILVPCVFVIGLLGNSVSIYVLTRKSMRCTTNIYLTALAITDIIYLTMVLLLSLQHYEYVHLYCKIYWKLFGTIHWLVDSLAYLSIYIAVGFTIERFIAIRYPLKRQTFCTESLAKKVIAGMAIFCLLSTISTALEHQHSIEFRLQDEQGNPCNRTAAARNPMKFETNSIMSSTAVGNSFELLNAAADEGSGAGSSITGSDDDVIIENADAATSQRSLMSLLAGSSLERRQAAKRSLKDAKEMEDPKYTMDIPLTSATAVGANANHSQLSSKDTHLDAHAEVPLIMWENEYTMEMAAESLNLLNISESCHNITYFNHKLTALGENEFYSDIWSYVTIVVFFLIPLCLLTTFNCFLVMLVRRSHTMRDKMTNASSIRRPKVKGKSNKSTSSVSQENRVTITLIAVVICFLICQVPWAVYLIVTLRSNVDPNAQRVFGNILNLLANINAATNFFLYCVLSDKYRKTVRQLLGSKAHKYDRSALTSASMYTSMSRCSYKPAAVDPGNK